ncbi:MAG: radical SAM protein [Pyrodictiaceae archaeon]
MRRRPKEALTIARERHARFRKSLVLPPAPPYNDRGTKCNICVNECTIDYDGKGYCGVWVNRGGKLTPVAGRDKIVGFAYLDPHPTNCVATPVCPGASSEGYPKYTKTLGPEYGYYNLAVFLGGCSLSCLFCQNWEHKLLVSPRYRSQVRTLTLNELVEKALNPKITCVCYFGGDPTPHAPLLLIVTRRMLRERRKCCPDTPFRVCWETNGLANPQLMKAMATLSLATGGIVKIDWKAWTPSIYEALTGISGEKAIERLKTNTRIVAELATKRSSPPLLVVSILLVPGYVDAYEVRMISRYISGLMREYGIDIPLVLLGFHPEHLMSDLPTTSKKHAKEALQAAYEEGIKRVFIGNEWLLSSIEY